LAADPAPADALKSDAFAEFPDVVVALLATAGDPDPIALKVREAEAGLESPAFGHHLGNGLVNVDAGDGFILECAPGFHLVSGFFV
jgi:hypothetical protein